MRPALIFLAAPSGRSMPNEYTSMKHWTFREAWCTIAIILVVLLSGYLTAVL
jgi:hypothetical protein